MKKWIFWILIVIFLAVFIVSGLYLADYFVKSEKAENEYDELAQMVEDAKDKHTRPTIPATDSTNPTQEVSEPTESPLVQVQDPETGEMIDLLPEFAEVYLLNNDLVGWIKIPGTKVNYPVVQNKKITDYYLKRNFYGTYSDYGAIYVKEECDVERPSDNVTIYGHRMNDGSMFASLHGYKKESYFQEHRYIFFDTLTEYHAYEILSVFLISSTVSNDFQYHLFIDAQDPEEFDEFVTQCKNRSLYDTGVDAQFGDKLITLSTCEYSNYSGRLVVVAKRVY